MEQVWEAQANQLASGLAHDQYLFQCGVLHGIKLIANMPDQIVTHERMQDEHAARTREADFAADSDRVAPFLNTPGWIDYERDRERAARRSARVASASERPGVGGGEDR